MLTNHLHKLLLRTLRILPTTLTLPTLMLQTTPTHNFCNTKTPNPDEYAKLKQRLIKFPYSHIAKGMDLKTVEAGSNDFLREDIVRDSVAFACLQEFKLPFLMRYCKFLFPGGGVGGVGGGVGVGGVGGVGGHSVTGEQIFAAYFGRKLGRIGQVLRNSQNQQQITYNLKILFYLYSIPNTNLDLSKFNLQKIQTQGTLPQKAYLIPLHQSNPTYLTYLQNFYHQFTKSPNSQKLPAAQVLISIPQFQSKLSSQLCEQALAVISQNAEKLQDWEIYRIVELVMETRFGGTRVLANRLTDCLFGGLSEENFQVKIPVVLKLLKFRSALGLNNDVISQYIKDNPLKFNLIFFKKRVNKQPFLTAVATKNSMRLLPEEIREQFSSYIAKTFEQVVQSGQCQPQLLIQDIKLCLKFFKNLPPHKIKTLQHLLEQKLIPMFQKEHQLTNWLIILLLIIDKNSLKKPKILQIYNQIEQFYMEKYEEELEFLQKSIYLEKITEIYYNKVRVGVPVQGGKLEGLNFSFLGTFQQVMYFCHVLSTVDLPAETKFNILQKILPKIQSFLDKNQFKSLKNIYLVLNTLHKSKCQKSKSQKKMKYIYQKFESAIMNLIQTERVAPAKKDLLFLKRMFTEDRSLKDSPEAGSITLHNFQFVRFLERCMDKPESFGRVVEEYNQQVGVKGRGKGRGRSRGGNGGRGQQE